MSIHWFVGASNGNGQLTDGPVDDEKNGAKQSRVGR